MMGEDFRNRLKDGRATVTFIETDYVVYDDGENEDDVFCEDHGHALGCPHDPTEEWGWQRDQAL